VFIRVYLWLKKFSSSLLNVLHPTRPDGRCQGEGFLRVIPCFGDKTSLHLVYFYLERVKMQVRFYANMRTIVRQEIFDVVELNGSETLRSLLNLLIENFPNIQPYLFNSKNELLPDVPIFVNGRNPRLEKLGVDMPLGSDDVVSMFSPISSGKMNVEVMRG
jgi:molybdopterin converting factor small subunit